MNRLLIYVVFLALGCMFINSCGTQAPLSGGDDDTHPPKVVDAESTPNTQTRFAKQDITIVFDEFIELKDVFKQVVISPPMIKNPTITSRGKKLKVVFDENEVLKDSTTYTINFGKAIRDFRVGNVLENYTFVFSTGEYIDSLTLEGQVIDPITKEGVSDVYVLLYDNLQDSAVYKERPYYFSISDDKGNFAFKHLKSDTFQIFGLNDLNLNYFYDEESESLAFIDSLIDLRKGVSSKIKLELSTAVSKLDIVETNNKTYGFLELIFNQELSDIDLEVLKDSVDYKYILEEEKMRFWYQNLIDSSISIRIFEDTIKKKFRKIDFSNDLYKLSLKENTGKRSAEALHPKDSLVLTFNVPIKRFLLDSITIKDTAAVVYPVSVALDTSDARKLQVFGTWKKEEQYSLEMLPNAIENIYDQTNDTLKSTFYVGKNEDFSKLQVKFMNLDTAKAYVILFKEKNQSLSKYQVKNDSIFLINMDRLIPKKYAFEIIEDLNRDGRWSPADFSTKRQAERIWKYELQAMKPDWELTLDIDLQSLD